MEFEALIAGGGMANRLGPLPCSKEILPLMGQLDKNRLKVACENLIEYYRIAGIKNIHFVIRKGKWDIPQLLGDGSDYGVNLAYHILKIPFGTPFTLDQAYPFIKNKYIAMGFPDIIMEPKNAFNDLKEKILENNADVVVGIFPIKQYWKWDMIEFEEGKIKNIIIKGQRSDLKYGWSNAVWSPEFSRFMHEFLQDLISKNEKGTRILPDGAERELYVGDVFVEAEKNGFKMDYVIFEDGYSTDIGTHDEMLEFLKKSIIER